MQYQQRLDSLIELKTAKYGYIDYSRDILQDKWDDQMCIHAYI